MLGNAFEITEYLMTNHLEIPFIQSNLNNITNNSLILNNSNPFKNQAYPFQQNLPNPYANTNKLDEPNRFSIKELFEKIEKELIQDQKKILNSENFYILGSQNHLNKTNLSGNLNGNESHINFFRPKQEGFTINNNIKYHELVIGKNNDSYYSVLNEELNNYNKQNQQMLQKSISNFDNNFNKSHQNIINIDSNNFYNSGELIKKIIYDPLLIKIYQMTALNNHNYQAFNQNNNIKQVHNITNLGNLPLIEYTNYVHLINNRFNFNAYQNNLINTNHNLNALINANHLVGQINNNLGNDFDENSKTDNLNAKKLFSVKNNFGKIFDLMRIQKRHLNDSDCGLKNFRCTTSNCGKSYKSKENLNLHIKNKHLGIKPYRCKYCTAKFSHRNGRTYHERKVHLNILPFSCNYVNCTLSFAGKSALKYHTTHQH